MRTSTPRTVASAVAVFAAIVLGNTAEAKDFAPAQPGFHVESAPRPFPAPAVEGYVYNEGLRWLSNVRIRVELTVPRWKRPSAGSSATLPLVVADTSSFRSTEWGRPTE